MHDIDDNIARGAIGEEILSQVKATHESINTLPTRVAFNELKKDVEEIKSDVKAIKAAL
jgi:hypothetical protein